MLFLRNDNWGCPLASIHTCAVCTETHLLNFGEVMEVYFFFLLVIANLTDEWQVCDLYCCCELVRVCL